MDNFTIILPVYNDWRSLNILLNKIEKSLKNIKNTFKILLINDNSTEINFFKLNKKKIFKSVEILNLKKNVGSQKAIATALKYINKNQNQYSDKFIIMDSDGEDDPNKIKEIINIVNNNKKLNIITLNRTVRKESVLFSILYEIHLFITFLITFNYIRFGNFTYINKKILRKLSKKNELWLAYSATLSKFFKKRYSIAAYRKKRIYGKSKMSYLGLIKHSLNIHSVYKKNIFFSYIFYSIAITFLFLKYISAIYIFIVISLFIFHIIILMNFAQTNVNGITFNQCLNNIKSVKKL
jgi:polyisoprenyl-phosphate glycosyltransferase